MKTKVLIIGPKMEIGGIETSLLGLLDSLDYSKYDVDLFLMDHTGELMPYINKNVSLIPEEKRLALLKWPIKELFFTCHWRVLAIRIFSKLIGRIRTIITHKANIYMSMCTRIVFKHIKPLNKEYDVALGFIGQFYFFDKIIKAKVKVDWVHSDFTSRFEKYDIEYYRSMWKKVDYIACVSESTKESFISIYPEFIDKTVVVENVLSKKHIVLRAESFNVENEMPNDGFYKILTIGRYSPAKNFDGAIEACKKLVDYGINIKWYFIGYGLEEEKLIRRINQLNVNNNVIMLGKKENPYPYIRACDLYVQPSRYEGKSVSVREAQILGKPVMITKYKTSSSQLEEGVDGHICDLSIDGIVSGIEYMIEHPEYADILSRNCQVRDYSNSESVNIEELFLKKEN